MVRFFLRIRIGQNIDFGSVCTDVFFDYDFVSFASDDRVASFGQFRHPDTGGSAEMQCSCLEKRKNLPVGAGL